MASASVLASHIIAGIRHRNLAQGLLEAQRTLTGDAGTTVAKDHLTGAAILAANRSAWIPVLTVVADIMWIATGKAQKIQLRLAIFNSYTQKKIK